MFDDIMDSQVWVLQNKVLRATRIVVGSTSLQQTIQSMTPQELEGWTVRAECSSVRFPLSSHSRNDRRRHPRVEKSFRVKILQSAATFESFSENVSLGGMKLRDYVPKAFSAASTFLVYGEDAGDRPLVLKFRVIENSLQGCRLQFEEISASTLETLKEWLCSFPLASNPPKAA